VGDGDFFDTLWILDVDGHRVLIDSYMSNAETLAVINSMEFAVNEDGK